MLDRDYFFEFAGMPQAGKTKIVNIVAHYLKRHGYRIEKYNGGSEYSPLHNAPIGILNLSLASQVVDFLVCRSDNHMLEHRIFFLDKGLIDRFIFTQALLWDGKIDEIEAQATSSFLMLPRLLACLDKIYIFVTSPELALEREYKDKLTKAPGEVMTANFLYVIRRAALDTYHNIKKRDDQGEKVNLIDTEEFNFKIDEVAKSMLEDIMKTINFKEMPIRSSL